MNGHRQFQRKSENCFIIVTVVHDVGAVCKKTFCRDKHIITTTQNC